MEISSIDFSIFGVGNPSFQYFSFKIKTTELERVFCKCNSVLWPKFSIFRTIEWRHSSRHCSRQPAAKVYFARLWMNACLLYENFDWKNFFWGDHFWKLVGHSYGPRYQKEKCSAWWKLNFSPQRCFLIALKSCRRSFRAILAHHVKENKVTLQTSTREGTSWAQCL